MAKTAERGNTADDHPSRVFRFALVDNANAESLGVVAFARPDFKEGDMIPQGAGRSLRVVNVLEPGKDRRDASAGGRARGVAHAVKVGSS